MPLRLRHAAASHVGLIRRLNEDSYVARPGLYAVCDGMGGARAGEVASETACRSLLEIASGSEGAAVLKRTVDTANREILRMSLEDPTMAGMGTTLTAALARSGGLILAHVGDSRAYLLRDGQLQQLTEDHSLVGEMVRRGQLTPQQAAVHPHRSIITRALGTEELLEPDLLDLELAPGDRVLLCTDGLSGMLSDPAIELLLAEGDDPQAITESLVQAALESGGEDNITVLVVLAEEGGEDTLLAASGEEAELKTSVSGAEGVELGPVQRMLERAQASTARVRPGLAPITSRRLLGRRAVVGLALVLVLLLGTGALSVFNSTVYWVGTSDGNVSLYRGLPYRVLGVELYRVVEVGPTPYERLDGYVRARVDAQELVTKEEGQRFVRSLAQETPGSVPTSTVPRGLPARPSTTTP